MATIHTISIIVPTVGKYTDCALPAQYLAAGVAHRVRAHFVFLLNSKVPDNRSGITTIDGVDVLVVGSDRYFGSCEENIYRVQDVARHLQARVVCIGEHDFIDWEALCDALDFAQSNSLEILGVNILGRQLKDDGSYSELLGIPALESEAPANTLAQYLVGGGVIDGAIGYSAMLSTYGPIDWAAFIGAHIYSRNAFVRVLQYRFVEHVYSFSHMHLRYIQESKLRYGFFARAPFHRISHEFKDTRDGTFTFGWLAEHRRVHGNSSCFWAAILSHVNAIRDDKLFFLVANAQNIGHVQAADGDIAYSPNYLIRTLFVWSHSAIAALLDGESHYLKTGASAQSLVEVNYVREFMRRLSDNLKMASAAPACAEAAPIAISLDQIVTLLRNYSLEPLAADRLLLLAAGKLGTIINTMSPELMKNLNYFSFQDFAAPAK